MAIARRAAAPIAIAVAYVSADHNASRTVLTRSDAARYPSRPATRASPAASTSRLLSPRAPPAWARPPGTIAATPVKARNATSRIVTRSALRSSEVNRSLIRVSLTSSVNVRPTINHVMASAGTSNSPNGTSRIAPRQATAATDGRMSDSMGIPPHACDGWTSSVRTWSVPSSIAPSRAAATSQIAGGSSNRDSPTTVTATSARSSLAERSSIAAMVRGVVHTRSGFAAVHARRSARERVLTTSAGVTHARRAWLIPQRT